MGTSTIRYNVSFGQKRWMLVDTRVKRNPHLDQSGEGKNLKGVMKEEYKPWHLHLLIIWLILWHQHSLDQMERLQLVHVSTPTKVVTTSSTLPHGISPGRRIELQEKLFNQIDMLHRMYERVQLHLASSKPEGRVYFSNGQVISTLITVIYLS